MTTLITAIVTARKRGVFLPESLTNLVHRLDLSEVENADLQHDEPNLQTNEIDITHFVYTEKKRSLRWVDSRVEAMFQDTINQVLLDEELVHSIEEKVSRVLLPKLKRDLVSYHFVRKERLLNSNSLEPQDDFLEHLLDNLQPIPPPQWQLPSPLKLHSPPPIFHRYAPDLSIPLLNKQRAGNKIIALTEKLFVCGLAHLFDHETTISSPPGFNTSQYQMHPHTHDLRSLEWKLQQRNRQRCLLVCGNCGHLKEAPIAFRHCCSEEEKMGSVGVGHLPEPFQTKILKQLIRIVIGFVTTLVTAAQLAAAGFVGSAVRILKRIGQRYIELFNIVASQQTTSQPPIKYCAEYSSQK